MKKLIFAAVAAVLAFAAAPALASNCSTYPYTLTNGTTADANQVMANLNLILNCANQSLAHNGANSDITSLSGLSTPLSTAQGGTGNTTGQPAGAAGGALTGTYPNPGIANTALPFEFYTFVGGLTGNAWTLAAYQPSTAVILTTAASRCSVGTSATGTTVYVVKDNGVSIGTATITASSTTCVVAITSSPYTVTAGHTLSISGPGTADVTAADVGITLGGTRG